MRLAALVLEAHLVTGKRDVNVAIPVRRDHVMVEQHGAERVAAESTRPGQQRAQYGLHGQIRAVSNQVKCLARQADAPSCRHGFEHMRDLLDRSKRLARVRETVPGVVEQIRPAELKTDDRQVHGVRAPACTQGFGCKV